MPTYEYLCVSGHVSDKVHSVADCDKDHFCDFCGVRAERQVSAPAVRGDYEGYQCPITSKWIEGRRAHSENLKQHGCRILEPGEKDEFVRRKKAANESLLNQIEDSACRTIQNMPQEKFEILAGELSHGGDADVIRTTLGA